MPNNDANPFRAERIRREAGGNPFRAERLSREQADGTGVFLENAALTLGDNVLAAPNAILGKLPAAGAAAIEGGLSVAGGGDFEFDRRYQDQLTQFPASVLNKIPTPKTTEVLQGIKSLPALMPGGDTFTERYDANMASTNERLAAEAEQSPMSAKAGEVAGDVGSLLLGRAPFSKSIKKGEDWLMKKGPDMSFGTGMMTPIEKGALPLLEKWITSTPVRTMARGAGRAVETGFEATMLDLVKGGDSLETAGYAAGGQLAGSAILQGTKSMLTGGLGSVGMKVTMAALAAAGIIQVLDQATPGGDNNPIGSLKTAYAKVTFGMMMGALAGLLGAGRLRKGDLADNLPRLADAIGSMNRAATLSLVEDYVNGDPREKAKIKHDLELQIKDPEGKRHGTIQR